MKKYTTLLLCGLFLLTTAFTCGDDFDVYTTSASLVNKTNDTIYVGSETSYDKELKAADFFTTSYNHLQALPPDSACSVWVWEPEDENYKADGKTKFMVFSRQTLNKYSVGEIVRRNIYDRLYQLTYTDLKRMDFTIEYKGDSIE